MSEKNLYGRIKTEGKLGKWFPWMQIAYVLVYNQYVDAFNEHIEHWNELYDEINPYPGVNLNEDEIAMKQYTQFICEHAQSIVDELNERFATLPYEAAIDENTILYMRLKDDHNAKLGFEFKIE